MNDGTKEDTEIPDRPAGLGICSFNCIPDVDNNYFKIRAAYISNSNISFEKLKTVFVFSSLFYQVYFYVSLILLSTF